MDSRRFLEPAPVLEGYTKNEHAYLSTRTSRGGFVLCAGPDRVALVDDENEVVVVTLTRQEMLDRAVRGLRAQGWQRSIRFDLPDRWGTCCYENPDGLRCAWGHVDLSLCDEEGQVTDLRDEGIGLAAQLSPEDAVWANALQACHDKTEAGDMEDRFRAFAHRHGLIFPEADS